MDMIYYCVLVLVFLSTTLAATNALQQRCVHCYGDQSFDGCGSIFCNDTQRCIIRALHQDNGTFRLYSGCVPKDLCDDDVLKSTSVNPYYQQICGKCCNGQDCNRDVCKSEINRYKTTLPPSTTTTTTTTTQVPTTTVPTITTTTTTTTIPTTSSTSTTTTVEPTTKDTQVHVTNSAKCEVCSGQLCGMIATSPVACPSSAPFCMNIIENSDIGERTYTKQCATDNECQRRWWEGSSDQPNCVKFVADDAYFFQFTCVYCCVTDGCNANLFPARSTLFKGRS